MEEFYDMIPIENKGSCVGCLIMIILIILLCLSMGFIHL